MLVKNISVNQKLRKYLLHYGGFDSKELAALRSLAEKHRMKEMQTTAEQGQLLYFLVKLLGAKKALELGVFLGYGTLSVALALPDNGKIIACDISDIDTCKALPYWEKAGVMKKIDLRIQPALDTLNYLQKQAINDIDFAFVDADKLNYMKYYNMIIPLLRPGGLMVFDNTLWGGEVANKSIDSPQLNNFRELNEYIANDKRVYLCLLPLADGMTLIAKK